MHSTARCNASKTPKGSAAFKKAKASPHSHNPGPGDLRMPMLNVCPDHFFIKLPAEDEKVSIASTEAKPPLPGTGNKRTSPEVPVSCLEPTSDCDFVIEIEESPLPPRSPSDGKAGNYIGRWTQEEHDKFVEGSADDCMMIGLRKYGKSWRQIAPIVETRDGTQVRKHALKFFRTIKKKYHVSNPYKQLMEGKTFECHLPYSKPKTETTSPASKPSLSPQPPSSPAVSLPQLNIHLNQAMSISSPVTASVQLRNLEQQYEQLVNPHSLSQTEPKAIYLRLKELHQVANRLANDSIRDALVYERWFVLQQRIANSVHEVKQKLPMEPIPPQASRKLSDLT